MEVPIGYTFSRKVHAYITFGTNLLVFRQPEFPEAGIQIPAGTIEDDEEPNNSVRREIIEETGLTNFTIVRKLGVYLYDMSPYRNEIQERHVYHVELNEEAASQWTHYEKHSGSNSDIEFAFYWVPLEPSINLEKDQGRFLQELCELLAKTKGTQR